jgi:hypothetical protein
VDVLGQEPVGEGVVKRVPGCRVRVERGERSAILLAGLILSAEFFAPLLVRMCHGVTRVLDFAEQHALQRAPPE